MGAFSHISSGHPACQTEAQTYKIKFARSWDVSLVFQQFFTSWVVGIPFPKAFPALVALTGHRCSLPLGWVFSRGSDSGLSWCSTKLRRTL